MEEERRAHAEAAKKWAEKAALLSSEVRILMYKVDLIVSNQTTQ